jgi:HPt (histidine-containing phosphotransfer) domain-containing protein
LYTAVERQAPAAPAPSRPAAPAEGSDVVDLPAALARVRGNQDALRSLAQLFVEESATLLPELRAALASADAAKLHRAAHTLKGSVSFFGAGRATAEAQRMEHMGRDHDLAGAAEALAALETEVERVRVVLEAYAAEQVS